MTDTTDDEEKMTADEIFEKLIERPSVWRELLKEIDYDPDFSFLYGPVDRHEPTRAFLAEGFVFYFDPTTLSWDRDGEVLVWLSENAKIEWHGVAGLYEYASGMEGDKSPWLLFQYITGIAETSQGMGLNSLMGIGTHDAEHLAAALENWSMDRSQVETFVELIMIHEERAADE